MDSATGKVKKRPAALKIVPCTTMEQRALLEREAANLRALSSQDVAVPYAPTLFDTCISVNDDSCQGTLAMRCVCHAKPRLSGYKMSKACEKHASQCAIV